MTDARPSLPLAATENAHACSCCATGEAAQTVETSAPVQAVYDVTGMTCGHCVSSVTEELSSLDAVTAVDVQLNAGGASRVTVGSTAPLDPAAVRSAVEEAGYTLVSA